MFEQEAQKHWQEIRTIHQNKENQFFYQIGGGLLLVVIGILLGSGLFSDDPGFKTNLYTEVLSITVTVVILNAFAERREERRHILELQERLVMEVGSQSNETAKHAVHELQRKGWLQGENGLLRGVILAGADLREVNLEKTNLQGVNLIAANLQAATLISSNLIEAKLSRAELQRAKLDFAKLQAANLLHAKLEGANLVAADLKGANLALANLSGARLEEANLLNVTFHETRFNEETLLPDNKLWTPETDMSRFTDPKHREFWRSSMPNLPANRGRLVRVREG